MAEIVLPKLSKDMTGGVIVNWHKNPGDSFSEGEPLFEVETSKVICEVEAKGNGTVKDILYEEGSNVAVGEAVMIVDMEERK